MRFLYLLVFIFTFILGKTSYSQVFIPHAYWRCQNTYMSESTAASADWNIGTYSNTNISGNSVVLSAGQTSGTYTSKVYDIFGGCSPLMPWLKLEWKTSLPFGKELPTTSEVATDYSAITAGLLTNLVGYWKLNESSGTTYADSSGSSNTGTKQGSITMGVTGQLLTAATLDGSTGYVSTTNTFVNPSIFTVAIWFKTTTTVGGKLIGFGNTQTGSSGNYDRHLYMTDTGTIYFGVYPGSVKTVNSTTTYNDGNWHHAVGTLSASGLQLYMDGALIATDATTTTAQNYTGYVRIGYDNTAGWINTPTSYFFNGTLDDAAVWTRQLSATEIQQLYRRGANRIKFQVKSCTLSDCSDIATWKGPDNTNATYFTEINNNGIQSTGLGNVLNTFPSMLFSNFPSLSIPTNRFFQYQATLQTDNTSFQPDLVSTTLFRGCAAGSINITTSGTWTLPAGCTSFTATVKGAGGGSARMVSGTKRAGGAGGQAIKSFANQPANTVYTVTIGTGGVCARTAGTGAYAGGTGGNAPCTVGTAGAGSGIGGTAGVKAGAGCNGGAGAYGGGGGGGGAGGSMFGAGGGGASSLSLSGVDYVVAGGGGGSGSADQGSGGTAGIACTLASGYNGGNAGNAAGGDAGGGGGGGACYCLGGTCNANPTSGGGAGGTNTGTTCVAANNGTAGSITISWP